MKKINFEGLCDVYEDFTSAICEEKIKLSEVTICQVKGYEKRDDKKDALNILATSVSDCSQKRKKLIVSNSVTSWLMKIGCFFEVKTTGKRYVPTEETIRHFLNDYINMNSDVKLNSFTEDILSIAVKFRTYGKIIFISKRPVRGFCCLIGVKSAKSSSGTCNRTINMAKALNDKFNGKIDFYTNYMNQKELDSEFSIMCHVDGHVSNDGVPLYILISDNITARKSISVSILAKINSRYYELQSSDISHRITTSIDVTLCEINDNIEKYKNITFNKNVSASDIIDVCITCIPKKSREKYKKLISESKNPLDAAYDVLSSDMFNCLNKKHKTLSYDGGKTKYKSALGTILR